MVHHYSLLFGWITVFLDKISEIERQTANGNQDSHVVHKLFVENLLSLDVVAEINYGNYVNNDAN